MLRIDNETMRDRIKQLNAEIKTLKDEIEKLKYQREDLFVEKWQLDKSGKVQEPKGKD